MSYYFAHDIGVESTHKGGIDSKAVVDKGRYKLPFEEWSHGRLTALNLILSYGLGFQNCKFKRMKRAIQTKVRKSDF